MTWVGLAAVLAVAGCSRVEDGGSGEWPQWRGPGGQGISAESDLPEVWSAGSANIRWQTKIPGAGNSSPIVSRGHVFLTTVYGEPTDRPRQAERRRHLQFVLIGLDLATGEILWQTPVFTSQKVKKHWFNSYAAPTPVTDGEHVFAYFGSVLAAVDFQGQIVWKQEIDPDYSRYSLYGAASSPILTTDAVVVVQDREEGDSEDVGWIAAFDKSTGNQIWRDEWQHTCCSYSTPTLYQKGRELQVLNSTSAEVVSYDPRSGERLWVAPYGSLQPVPSMVMDGDMLSVPGGVHGKLTFVLRLAGSGKSTTTEVLWYSNEGVPEIASPILYQEMLFVVTEGGIMTCYDARTGATHWRSRLAGDRYHSSLVAGDSKIYATNQLGVTSVVAADSSFRLISENDLEDGGVSASPAIAGGSLLIRSGAHLYAIGAELGGVR